MIVELLKEGLGGGSREGRTCLISAALLSASVYVSSMNWLVSLAVISLSIAVTYGRALKLLAGLLPFYLLFGISIVFTGLYGVKTFLAFLALISAGGVVYSTSVNELAGALLFFRVPKRAVSILTIAVSMLPMLLEDFQNVRELYQGGVSRYYVLLKAFVSTAILRAINMSESLYSKNYTYRAFGKLRRPDKKDVLVVVASAAIFVLSNIS